MKLNIYQKEYWIKKGHTEKDSINLVNKWKRETSCRCKEFWIKKGYNEDESIELVKNYQRNSTLKRTKDSYKNMLNPYVREYWIKKGIIDDVEINKKIEEAKVKSNPYISLEKDKYDLMIENRKKTYYAKSIEELKTINKKRGRTKLQLIDEYGYYEANEMVKNRGKNKKFYRRYSKVSMIFFDKLQGLLENEILLYGRNEKWIRINENKGYFVDLFLERKNKIIEFNGDFFHANPIKYKDTDIIKISENEQYKAVELWDNDKIKIDNLRKLNYDIHIIWENDVNNQIDIELKKCVDFLKK